MLFFLFLNGNYCETGSNRGLSKLGVLDVCPFADVPSFNEKTILSQWKFI